RTRVRGRPRALARGGGRAGDARGRAARAGARAVPGAVGVRRLLARLAACLALAFLGACATHVAPKLPESLDFLYSAPAAGELPASETQALQAAWRDVLAGDTKRAVSRYEKLLRRHPGSLAARTGLAYARLRAGEVVLAQGAFLDVLSKRPEDV